MTFLEKITNFSKEIRKEQRIFRCAFSQGATPRSDRRAASCHAAMVDREKLPLGGEAVAKRLSRRSGMQSATAEGGS